MKVTHELEVSADVDEVWAAFNHVELLASHLPGATLTSVDDHDFTGALRVKLGTTILSYVGSGRLEERLLGGRRTVLTVNGTDARGKGTVDATITTSFSAAGPRTRVSVEADLSFTGAPAQLPAGVVEDATQRLLSALVDGLNSGFADGLAADVWAADRERVPLDGRSTDGASPPYSYHPPRPASQTDFDVFTKVAPVWTKRLAPPLAAGLAVAWLVRRVRRR